MSKEQIVQTPRNLLEYSIPQFKEAEEFRLTRENPQWMNILYEDAVKHLAIALIYNKHESAYYLAYAYYHGLGGVSSDHTKATLLIMIGKELGNNLCLQLINGSNIGSLDMSEFLVAKLRFDDKTLLRTAQLYAKKIKKISENYVLNNEEIESDAQSFELAAPTNHPFLFNFPDLIGATVLQAEDGHNISLLGNKQNECTCLCEIL